jgi:hypothetical protein
MATLDKSATMRWLVATALKAMTTGQGEHDPHEVRFGTTRGSLSTFLLSRRWRYQLAELGVNFTNPLMYLPSHYRNNCSSSIRSCAYLFGRGDTRRRKRCRRRRRVEQVSIHGLNAFRSEQS